MATAHKRLRVPMCPSRTLPDRRNHPSLDRRGNAGLPGIFFASSRHVTWSVTVSPVGKPVRAPAPQRVALRCLDPRDATASSGTDMPVNRGRSQSRQLLLRSHPVKTLLFGIGRSVPKCIPGAGSFVLAYNIVGCQGPVAR